MRALSLAVALLIGLGAGPVLGGEFSGKLERLDRQTVTLLGPDKTRLVLKADEPGIQKAAAFIGKSVNVEFSVQEGHNRLLLFRPISSHLPEDR